MEHIIRVIFCTQFMKHFKVREKTYVYFTLNVMKFCVGPYYKF